MNILKRLYKANAIQAPDFVINQLQYMVQMGSVAYGVSDDQSDIDIYGFCIPNKNTVFPHLAGEINGFGRQKQSFNQWQQHHIVDTSTQKEYDFSIYGIIKYFQLCMENNPNIIDSLFVPVRCILHSTRVGNHIRENRKLFLHAGAWHKFKGYAYSQLNKLKTKAIMSIIAFEKKFKIETLNINYNDIITEIDSRISGIPDSKLNSDLHKLTMQELSEYRGLLIGCKEPTGRKQKILKYGYDVKFAYHTVRLLGEVEQILTECDLDIERDRERLKSIRNGDWTQERITEFFEAKEKLLEAAYQKTKLPYKPDENKIKRVLLECLEMHFGSLDKCMAEENKDSIAIQKIKDIVGSI